MSVFEVVGRRLSGRVFVCVCVFWGEGDYNISFQPNFFPLFRFIFPTDGRSHELTDVRETSLGFSFSFLPLSRMAGRHSGTAWADGWTVGWIGGGYLSDYPFFMLLPQEMD